MSQGVATSKRVELPLKRQAFNDCTHSIHAHHSRITHTHSLIQKLAHPRNSPLTHSLTHTHNLPCAHEGNVDEDHGSKCS